MANRGSESPREVTGRLVANLLEEPMVRNRLTFAFDTGAPPHPGHFAPPASVSVTGEPPLPPALAVRAHPLRPIHRRVAPPTHEPNCLHQVRHEVGLTQGHRGPPGASTVCCDAPYFQNSDPGGSVINLEHIEPTPGARAVAPCASRLRRGPDRTRSLPEQWQPARNRISDRARSRLRPSVNGTAQTLRRGTDA